jgi:hypothetical protein
VGWKIDPQKNIGRMDKILEAMVLRHQAVATALPDKIKQVRCTL